MESVKRNPVCSRGITRENPLGSTKILIIETLALIINNDEKWGFATIEEINETTWHILCLWFFGNRFFYINYEFFTKLHFYSKGLMIYIITIFIIS